MTSFSVSLEFVFLQVILPRKFKSAELPFDDQTVPDEATLLGRVEALKAFIERMADRINTQGVRGDFDLDAILAALGAIDYDEVPAQIEPILLRTTMHVAKSYTPHQGSGYDHLCDDGCFIAAFRFDGTPTLDLFAVAAFVTIPDRYLVFYQVLRDGEIDPYFEKLRENPEVYETVMRNVWGVIEA